MPECENSLRNIYFFLDLYKTICFTVIKMKTITHKRGEIMKIEKHPLLDKQYDLEFDNKKHGRVALSAGINPLNGSWMWWYSTSHSMFAGTKRDIKSLVKDLRAFADNKIISDSFSFI